MRDGHPYENLPLKPGSRQIRLFSLQPDHKNFYAPIEGRLSISVIEDGTHYEALSYTWGLASTSNQSQVHLSDGLLRISNNLDMALRHLRQHKTNRVLWIDAICINQSDDSEKSDQVAQMREVYENASEVQIWLGPAGVYSHDGINVLTGLTQAEGIMKGLDGPFATFDHHALDDILSRDWWSRLWVVQEVAVAKRAKLICGYDVMSWPSDRDLKAVMSNISRCIETSEWTTSSRLARMSEILQMQLWRAGSSPPSLLELVLSVTTRYCTNGLDRIFALRGLASDTEAAQNSPDYSISTEVATERLFHSTILQTNSLDILCCDRAPLATTPSWLSSLTSGIDDNRLAFNLPQASPLSFRTFNASGGSEPALSIIHNGLYPDLLVVRGFYVTNIYSNLTLRPFNPESSNTTAKSSPLLIWSRLWCALNERPKRMNTTPYGDSRGEIAAAWRTLIADTKPDSRKRPDDTYGEQIISLTISSSSLLNHSQNLYVKNRDYLEPEETPNFLLEYYAWAVQSSMNRVLIETADERIGWAPREAEEGDCIFVFLGATVPFVLRPVGLGRYKLVGACYVHGIMDGETIISLNSGEYKLENITLT
jgi:hypothetical protein